jgi:hypothetical protein
VAGFRVSQRHAMSLDAGLYAALGVNDVLWWLWVTLWRFLVSRRRLLGGRRRYAQGKKGEHRNGNIFRLRKEHGASSLLSAMARIRRVGATRQGPIRCDGRGACRRSKFGRFGFERSSRFCVIWATRIWEEGPALRQRHSLCAEIARSRPGPRWASFRRGLLPEAMQQPGRRRRLRLKCLPRAGC